MVHKYVHNYTDHLSVYQKLGLHTNIHAGGVQDSTELRDPLHMFSIENQVSGFELNVKD